VLTLCQALPGERNKIINKTGKIYVYALYTYVLMGLWEKKRKNVNKKHEIEAMGHQANKGKS
jgi:hypothetical protein